jgi:hypothetical protein
MNAEGDLSRITKGQTDKKFHVVGDLAVTPFVLLKPAINELKRLLDMLKDREVWILDVLPRFLLIPCVKRRVTVPTLASKARQWSKLARRGGAHGAKCAACRSPLCAASQVHRNRRFADWRQGCLHGVSYGHAVQDLE